MSNRKAMSFGVAFICFVLVSGACGFLLSERNNYSVARSEMRNDLIADSSFEMGNSDGPRIYTRDSFDGSITFEGNRYEVNTGIDTVLFLGIDSSNQEREGTVLSEGGRSDSIILFSIDNKNKLITPLEINRDTMVEVDIYDNDGNFLAKGTEQLTMQYSYGRSVRQACNLTKEKISDLLCRRRIDGVISLTMEGIVPIVDSIGGVNIKLATDETQLDPSYVEGAVIHLDGKSALDFVRIRDVETRGSNIKRMSRQTQFMMALFQNIKLQGGSVIDKMEEAGGEYLYMDVDADSLNHFTEYDYSGDVLILPGQNNTDGIHDEFYVDERKLTEMILNLFFVKK